ncbi:uncharacterized protein LOC144948318 isoform X1 [Lampetra fluviatilis]
MRPKTQWLQEILNEAQLHFSATKAPEMLPKTPSAKNRRRLRKSSVAYNSSQYNTPPRTRVRSNHVGRQSTLATFSAGVLTRSVMRQLAANSTATVTAGASGTGTAAAAGTRANTSRGAAGKTVLNMVGHYEELIASTSKATAWPPNAATEADASDAANSALASGDSWTSAAAETAAAATAAAQQQQQQEGKL